MGGLDDVLREVKSVGGVAGAHQLLWGVREGAFMKRLAAVGVARA